MRLAAAKALQAGADERRAAARSSARAAARDRRRDPRAVDGLRRRRSGCDSPDKAVRVTALRALADSTSPATRTLLIGLLAKKGDVWAEPDGDVRAEAEKSLAARSRAASPPANWSPASSAASRSGSILLLAALGLAITYGLMGVINMAHGELIMIGAYATYVVQNLFRQHAPGAVRLRICSPRCRWPSRRRRWSAW